MSEVVDYKAVRAKIKTGDVLVCKGKYGFSKLISFAIKSDQTHVGWLERREELDRIVVLESVESKGVRPIALSKYLTNYDNKGNPYSGEIYVLRPTGMWDVQTSTPEKVDEAISWAIDRFGNPYSLKQIWKIAYSLFFKRAITKLTANERTEWVCSVFVGDILSILGILIPHKNYLKPSDFVVGENFELVGRLK